MAGYSDTPLPKKLGIKPDHRVCLLNCPIDGIEGLGSHELPERVEVRHDLRGTKPFDGIVLFCPSTKAMRTRFTKAADRLTPAGGLWVAWLKKTSGIPTDLTEAAVREQGRESGLVDVKICAIDDRWSGLRFVRRVRDR